MNAAKLAAEFARPLTDRTILIGMLAFVALLMLARAAGLLGLWLLIITVPAFCRFLIEVLQSRIEDRPVAAPGMEVFNLVDSLWTFLPLVQIVLGLAAVGAVADVLGVIAATIVALMLGLLLPASFGMLGLTHSPAAALDPRDLARLIREIGPRYLLLPAICAAAGAMLAGLRQSGAPVALLQPGEVYLLFTLFSTTGAFVALSGARELVAGPQPELQRGDPPTASCERERNAVLSHAYGLVSRGNRSGGLQHIDEFIHRVSKDRDKYEQFDWFFRKMLEWEDKDAGLLLGQRLLHDLVGRGARGQALKLLSRCYHENPAFYPLPADREALRDMARAAQRDDLLAALQASGH